MNYTKLVISVNEKEQEDLIHRLSELHIDAFEQQENRVILYLPDELNEDGKREQIEVVLRAYPGSAHIASEETIEEQNWNEEWEKTIEPRRIGSFFVKPSWSDESPPPGTIPLNIDPKMAFGTGYHETTRLMLEYLPEVIRPGDHVLDAGTGTGILSIASIKLEAAWVFAFDIDEWSITNSRENMMINKVAERVELKKGSIDRVPGDIHYQVVLANIERNTILDMLPRLGRLLEPGGDMLLSGLLEKDEGPVRERAGELGLSFKGRKQENKWIALHLGC